MVGPPRRECAPMTSSAVDVIAAVLFGVAVLHTFLAKQFERLAHRFPRHSGLFHLLGEVEVVFGFGPSCSWSQSLSWPAAIWRSRTRNPVTTPNHCSCSWSWWFRLHVPCCKR